MAKTKRGDAICRRSKYICSTQGRSASRPSCLSAGSGAVHSRHRACLQKIGAAVAARVGEKGAAIDERLADVSARRGLIPPALPMIRLRRRSRLSGYARRALMQTASSRLQTMTPMCTCTQLNYEKRPSDTCVSGGQIFGALAKINPQFNWGSEKRT